MPFTWHVLRQAAMMRHEIVVRATYGRGRSADAASRRHEQYVRAFYGY
jgi:hypothetical protein